MTDQPNSPETGFLLALLDEGYNANAWHGANLLESLDQVDAIEAAWRPADGQRNIWEITVHAAYWKHRVWQALKPEAPNFRYEGKDWFTRPESTPGVNTPKEWEADKALLDEIQTGLKQTVAQLRPEDMDRELSKDVTVAWLVRGAGMHDVYHAGQILSLRQWYESRKQ